MNKEFQNKKHTQTRTGTHTKERNSESLRLKAPTHKQRAPGPNASDDALVVIVFFYRNLLRSNDQPQNPAHMILMAPTEARV